MDEESQPLVDSDSDDDDDVSLGELLRSRKTCKAREELRRK